MIAILAGGLFGAAWNTTESVWSKPPPASARPAPAVEPNRTVESPDGGRCEEHLCTV